MINTFSNFLKGFSAPLLGIGWILKNPKAMVLSMGPFFIGLFIFFGALFFGFGTTFSTFNDWLSHWIGQKIGEGWVSGVLGPLLASFGTISAILILFLLTYAFYMIVAGPFLSLLCEDIYKKTFDNRLKPGSTPLMIRMFFISLGKMLLFIPFSIFAFVTSFFPPLSFLSILIIFLIMAFDSMDYAFEVDYLGLKERISFFLKFRSHFLGLALSLGLVGIVPGLLFLVFPAFVAGSTKLYLDLSNDRC